MRAGRIQRCHAGEGSIKPAADDVTIDQSGELGKRECESHRRKGGMRGCRQVKTQGVPPEGAGEGNSGAGSLSVRNESAGASLFKPLSSDVVMSVASLV